MDRITISNLRVSFEDVEILHGINLSISKGGSLGLVGESGCGKSVTWLAALRLLPKSARISGEVIVDEVNLVNAPIKSLEKIRGARIAIIFQDPSSSLNPVIPIGKQIAEAVMLHKGMSKPDAMREAVNLLQTVGIPDAQNRLKQFPHQFSGGQNQRVMIAMALAGDPDILIADEPTTALDATIQAQILDLLIKLRHERNMGLVFISHDLGAVAQVCDEVCVMYAGNIVEKGPTKQLFNEPYHPYTNGLFSSIPPFNGSRERLVPIDGVVPEPGSIKGKCTFMPRCKNASNQCSNAIPPLRINARDSLRSLACFNPQISNHILPKEAISAVKNETTFAKSSLNPGARHL